MRTLLRLFAVSALCTIGAIGAHAQTVTCQNAQYDPEVVARYPNVAKRCLDIVTRGGEQYAVVKGRLERVNTNGSVVVRMKQPDGSYTDRRTVKTDPNLKVLIDGKPAHVQDLAPDQEITAYVKVHEPVIALAPADDSTPLSPTPLEYPQERMAALPRTGSMVPLLGLMGSVFLAFGGFLTAIRYRRR